MAKKKDRSSTSCWQNVPQESGAKTETSSLHLGTEHSTKRVQTNLPPQVHSHQTEMGKHVPHNGSRLKASALIFLLLVPAQKDSGPHGCQHPASHSMWGSAFYSLCLGNCHPQGRGVDRTFSGVRKKESNPSWHCSNCALWHWHRHSRCLHPHLHL